MKIFSKKAIRDGNSISFSVNRVQYASLEEKVKLVKEVGAMGLLTVDQALMILDLAPIGGEEGKKRMLSLNYINADIAKLLYTSLFLYNSSAININIAIIHALFTDDVQPVNNINKINKIMLIILDSLFLKHILLKIYVILTII